MSSCITLQIYTALVSFFLAWLFFRPREKAKSSTKAQAHRSVSADRLAAPAGAILPSEPFLDPDTIAEWADLAPITPMASESGLHRQLTALRAAAGETAAAEKPACHGTYPTLPPPPQALITQPLSAHDKALASVAARAPNISPMVSPKRSFRFRVGEKVGPSDHRARMPVAGAVRGSKKIRRVRQSLTTIIDDSIIDPTIMRSLI